MVDLKELRTNARAAADASAEKYKLDNIADAMGVTKVTWLKYEEDPSRMRGDTLIKCADYFGVTVEDILGHE